MAGGCLITLPLNGEPASQGNGSTLGLTTDSPAQTDAWHSAGPRKWRNDLRGSAGAFARPPKGAGSVLAYLRDPDGNKLCALHRMI